MPGCMRGSTGRSAAGFTLLEMAVVLVILSLLLGGLLMPLAAAREQEQRRATRELLLEIEQALLGFAAARGRLPCPATAASSGREEPVGGGVCTGQHGFVPAVDLGIRGSVNADGLLLDAWGSPLRYSVTDANANGFTSSGSNSLRALGLEVLAPDLRVCPSGTSCANPVATGVPAVLVSAGRNRANAPSVHEAKNLDSSRDFVFREYNDADFDDIIVWLSPNLFYMTMIAAGQLP